MITQNSMLQTASLYAPCLAAALSNVVPAQVGVIARSSSRFSQPAGHSCSSSRSISSGKEADADDKLGRPTTPWVRQVISGVDLMRHPKYNKGVSILNPSSLPQPMVDPIWCVVSVSLCR